MYGLTNLDVWEAQLYHKHSVLLVQCAATLSC